MSRHLIHSLALVAALTAALPAGAQTVTGTSSAPGRAPATHRVRPTVIGCGQVVEAYAQPGVPLLFAFHGQADSLVDLAMNEVAGFVGSFPEARVTSPSGGQIAVLIGTELETLELAETGTYRIEVTSSGAGIFTLRLGCLFSGGTPIEPGDLVLASIDDAGELDYYDIKVETGGLIEPGGIIDLGDVRQPN